ncbi:MAG: hypothetical protein ACI855_002715, partial [Myxococcota bacterium]
AIASVLGPFCGPVYLAGKVAVMTAGGPIADSLWGEGYAADTVENMDGNDTATRVEGGGVEGNLGSTHSGQLTAGYEASDVLSKTNGKLDKHTKGDFKVKFTYGYERSGINVSSSIGVTIPSTGKGTTASFGIRVGSAKQSNLSAIGSMASSAVRGAVVALAEGIAGEETLRNTLRIANAFAAVLELAMAAEGSGTTILLDADYNLATGQLTIVAKVERAIVLPAAVQDGVGSDLIKLKFKAVAGTVLATQTFDLS